MLQTPRWQERSTRIFKRRKHIRGYIAETTKGVIVYTATQDIGESKTDIDTLRQHLSEPYGIRIAELARISSSPSDELTKMTQMNQALEHDIRILQQSEVSPDDIRFYRYWYSKLHIDGSKNDRRSALALAKGSDYRGRPIYDHFLDIRGKIASLREQEKED